MRGSSVAIGMRALLLCFLWPVAASAADLDRLYDRIAVDLRAGKPLTVRVDVALCDNSLITCGGHGLGDGDDAGRNLYWASSGGLRGWFERRGSGWQRVQVMRAPAPHVVEEVRYRRSVEPNDFWREHGVTEPFSVEVHAVGWRGRDIGWALKAFAAETVGEGAHLAAYVGHNGWMDVESFDWPRPGPHPAGAIAIACLTRPYLKGVVALPLLLTNDLLFAGSHALDGALQAVMAGAPLAEIRERAARSYADGEGKSYQRVRNAFINPADRRW
jgi:hypothetical protein